MGRSTPFGGLLIRVALGDLVAYGDTNLRAAGEPGGDVKRIEVPTDLILPVSPLGVLGERRRGPYDRRETITLPDGEEVVLLWELIVLALLLRLRGGIGSDCPSRDAGGRRGDCFLPPCAVAGKSGGADGRVAAVKENVGMLASADDGQAWRSRASIAEWTPCPTVHAEVEAS